jgi:acetyl esterase
VLERVESTLVVSALRLPEPVLLRLLGGRRVAIDGEPLDLATQMLLRLMVLAGYPPLNEVPVAQGRAFYAARTGAIGARPRPMQSVADRSIDGPHGPIRVRLYVPHSAPRPAPLLVYYHGGGWVIGDLETHDAVCRLLAAEASCAIVAVDYRRAPEHKFPAAVEDAIYAYRWAVENAAELGCDPRRTAVAGDSAGGNLAAVVARLARDAGGPQPCLQLLVYPVTDLRIESRSYELFADGFFLTRDMMRWFRDHYLSSEAERMDPRASPLLADDLSRLAPAFMMTAGFDPLRDEGRAYAERLRAAGNEVTHRNYDSLIHGFFSMTGGIPAARVAVAEATAALRRAFAR